MSGPASGEAVWAEHANIWLRCLPAWARSYLPTLSFEPTSPAGFEVSVIGELGLTSFSVPALGAF